MRSLFFIISACLLLAGCIKIPGSEEKFITIRGRLVQDCALEPVSGATLRFLIVKGGFPGQHSWEQLGEVVTDAEGHFEVKFPFVSLNEFTVQRRLAGQNEFYPLTNGSYRWSERPQAKLYDWGNVYVSQVPVYINVVANIGPGLRAKDSLVINYKGRPITYSPVPEQIHLNDVSYYVNGPETDVSAFTPLIIRYSTSYNNINKDNVYGQVYTKAFEAPVYLCSTSQVDTVSIDW